MTAGEGKMHPGQTGERPIHNFSRNPMLVYWEMTQACNLACKHCRAEAMPQSHPLELNTCESQAFLKQVAEFGAPLPHLILTGGDPLRRNDLYPLIQFARELRSEEHTSELQSHSF